MRSAICVYYTPLYREIDLATTAAIIVCILYWIRTELVLTDGSVAEWLACWTHAQKGLSSNRSRDAVSYNSLRQTVHTDHASVRQEAKLVAALLRVARVTAGLVESNGGLQPGL